MAVQWRRLVLCVLLRKLGVNNLMQMASELSVDDGLSHCRRLKEHAEGLSVSWLEQWFPFYIYRRVYSIVLNATTFRDLIVLALVIPASATRWSVSYQCAYTFLFRITDRLPAIGCIRDRAFYNDVID